MSEFFDKRSAAKTPRMYKECRDFTINRCRENLKQAVTFQEVRRMLIVFRGGTEEGAGRVRGG